MFLSCGGAQTSSGGGSTVTNNYYSYFNAPINTTNFSAFPYISPHLVQSGATYVNNHLAGTFTFTMKELSVFNSLSAYNVSGGTIVFKNGGALVKTVSVAATVNDQILFDSVEFTLGTTELGIFTWQTVPPYITKTFGVAGEIIDFYPLEWQNASSDGTTLSAAGVGNIVARGFVPFVIYAMSFSGTVYLYDENNALLYEDTVLHFPNPVWRMEVAGTITSISYDARYNVPFEYVTFGAAETYLYSYSAGTFTFNRPTFIKNIVMSGPQTITINGASYAATGSFDKVILASTLSGTLITSIDCEKQLHFEQQISNFNTLSFGAFSNGEINIENDYFLITSADQLNGPAMISGGTVICSADANCLTPVGGAGTLTVAFKQPTYVQQLTFSGGSSGTISIGSKSYAVETAVNCRDFVNANCMLTDSIVINLTAGALSGIVASTILPSYYERDSQNYVIEDFSTQSVEFASTIFSTNVASELGTPNSAFGGPGVGLGGGPGNGQNSVFLGGATQSNINFDTERWVRSIQLINCRIGYKLDFLNAAAVNISSIYVGNFGQNSVHVLSVNKKVKTINITGNLAIAAITYGAPDRIVVGLIDNAPTPADIGSAQTGNFILKVVGAATAIISATNATASAAGAINMQLSASATGESLYAQWPAGSPLQIYHNTFKTGGTGALLYYVVYF